VIALFLVATVPMVLQALSGTSGGTYGLILIVQQIGFMVIGIAINQRFLLRAGLWVALGSVLYQLKGLGWAFLAIVAIILIGIAMYRLQRHDDGQPKP
jgi:formate hydrogenlyase subunit 3/multisubunit Na+/H+ antiporter MnhD subunit